MKVVSGENLGTRCRPFLPAAERERPLHGTAAAEAGKRRRNFGISRLCRGRHGWQ
jgi:hypothetical protein